MILWTNTDSTFGKLEILKIITDDKTAIEAMLDLPWS